MAEEKPDAEKTEAPSERRREQAREKGDRLTSSELATAMSGIAGALWLYGFGVKLADGMRISAASALSIGPADIADFRPLAATQTMLAPLAVPLLALGLLALVAVAIGQALSGGISFTPSLIAPKFERMDPVKGFGRIFGRKGLVELLKALLKVAILVGLSVWLIRGEVQTLLGLSAMPLDAALGMAGGMGLKLMLWLSLGLALIAGGDIPVQIFEWLKRLRMTKQELKDEAKEQEGSPEMKYAIRRMARESLKRASRSAMADATVVLTNPTHFAVALRYRPELDQAPVIVARGRGLVAEVIRELAAEQGVVILSYPSVARAIYFTGRVGTVIRADLYAAVAAILAFVLRAGTGQVAPDVEAPPGARFDEEGRMVAE